MPPASRRLLPGNSFGPEFPLQIPIGQLFFGERSVNSVVFRSIPAWAVI